ncbi:MAG: hypothetical protein AAGL66_05015 [Pseudomonadota bacterium]
MFKPQYRRCIATFAVAVLLVQVLVPRGYMPANLASGWFVALCPDGLTPQATMALFGADPHHNKHSRDQQHHEHQYRHHAAHQDHDADGTADPSRPCELAGLYVDALESTVFFTEQAERQTLDSPELDPATPRVPSIRHFHPRAPPLA